jgi:hypothetical protein
VKRHLFLATALIAGNAFASPAQSSGTTVTVKESGGSTIVGEQDSAMGLTLTPWKEEYATGLDQPPSLYRAPAAPVSDNGLQRQTEYRDDLGNYRRSHSQYTP